MKKSLLILLASILLVSVVIVTLPVATPTRANDGSTSLTLVPELKRVSPLDIEEGLGRFYIDLQLSNVQDLDWFKFTIIFDGDILAPIPRGWYGVPSKWSGGGTSSGSIGYGSYVIDSYELMSPISGSGVLLSYWFYPKAAGTTKVELREAELKDSNGDVIPYTFIGNEVEVLPFETWLKDEYDKLSNQYDELQTQYTDLQAKYGALSGQYGSLNSNYSSLQEDYADLYSNYTSLKEDYSALESTYSSLQEDYTSLSAEVAVLEADYLSLEEEYQAKVEQLEVTKSRLSTTQILLYVFIGTTAVLLFLMTFLLLRRRGATP